MASRFGAFIPFLADSFSSIVCDSDANKSEDFGTSVAIGAGPFKLVNWVKGDVVELAKNPDYKNFGKPVDNMGAPHIDKLIVKTVPEAQTRLAALHTGEVQIAEPPFDDIQAIKDEGKLDLVVADNTGQNVFWEFTVSRPPFNDIRARQAVAYATDPQMAIDIIYGGLSQREWCPIARGVFGNDQAFCKQYGYPYDPDKAKALLAELGYGPDKPLETTMYVWTGGNRQKLAEIFQNQLAQVGIKAGDRDHGHRHHERQGQGAERADRGRPRHLRHDDLVLVRPGHPLPALAFAGRLFGLPDARAGRDAREDPDHDRSEGTPRGGR